MLPDYVLGLDLAQASDWTALCVLARNAQPRNAGEATYDCSHLERWRGESYMAVPARVERVLAGVRALHDARRTDAYMRGERPLPDAPRIALVVDKTGVGAAVVDFLKAAKLDPIGVTIHGGDLVTEAERDDFRVPKRDLAAVVAILLQQRRLRIAAALPLAGTLRHELENFRVTISASGHDRYAAGGDALSWREQPHDDLVLAVSLGCWYAEYQARDTAGKMVHVGSYLPRAADDDRGPGRDWWKAS